MGDGRSFPIQLPASSVEGCPSSVPWGFVEQYAARLLQNHGQTVQRLAERGGLGICELAAAVIGVSWLDAPPLAKSIELVNDSVSIWSESPKTGWSIRLVDAWWQTMSGGLAIGPVHRTPEEAVRYTHSTDGEKARVERRKAAADLVGKADPPGEEGSATPAWIDAPFGWARPGTSPGTLAYSLTSEEMTPDEAEALAIYLMRWAARARASE